MLTVAELKNMRMVADDFFPDTCTIQTRTEAVDALGGITHTWANTYVLVSCRLDPIRGSETIVNATLQGMSGWILNIPYDQAITIEDRIIHDSKTYEVIAVWDTQSYRTIRRAELKRIDSG